MMDRLTYSGTKEAKSNVTIGDVLNKLAHYEDLEEAGRLMILPKDYDMEKLKEEHCPFFLGFDECCVDYADCDECWEAALKEREAE